MFWTWIGSAFLESIVVSVLPLFTLQNFHRGREDTFLFAGATCLSVVVVVVNLKVLSPACVATCVASVSHVCLVCVSRVSRVVRWR